MDYYSTKVQCPFWRKGSAVESKIFCEGPVPDSNVQIWFKGDEKKRKIHMARYCCMHYAMCPMYKSTIGELE